MTDRPPALRRAWDGFVALCARREPGTTLAAFRIALAAVVLYSLLSVALAGLVPLFWYDVEAGGYRHLPAPHPVVTWLGGPSPRVTWILWGTALVGACGLLLGWRGRVCAGVTQIAYFAFTSQNPEVAGGYDAMICNGLWLLVLGNATATCSLDARLRHGAWIRDTPVPAWPRYVLVYQLLLVYTTTGLNKLSAHWTPGGDFSALYWIFQDPTWTRFDMGFAAWVFPLTQVGTAVTWVFEVFAFTLLAWFYFRHTADRGGPLRRLCRRVDLRIPFAAIGIGMHLGILVLLNVGPFSWISMAYYLNLLHPRELEAWGRAIARPLRPRSLTPSPSS